MQFFKLVNAQSCCRVKALEQGLLTHAESPWECQRVKANTGENLKGCWRVLFGVVLSFKK